MGAFEDEIRSLLDARTKTLSAYQQVMSYHPFENSEILREVLEDFCEQLVHYSGKVHFSLLNYIEEHFAEQTDIIEKANMVAGQLVQNTQIILDFQDAYSYDSKHTDIQRLEKRMNQIGEIIADRIAMEDQLLDMVQH